MIETDRGIIRGYNITVDKFRINGVNYPNVENYMYKMISIFLGIPYALPPGVLFELLACRSCTIALWGRWGGRLG